MNARIRDADSIKHYIDLEMTDDLHGVVIDIRDQDKVLLGHVIVDYFDEQVKVCVYQGSDVDHPQTT